MGRHSTLNNSAPWRWAVLSQGRDLVAAATRQDLREQLVEGTGAKLDVREGPRDIQTTPTVIAVLDGLGSGKWKQVEPSSERARGQVSADLSPSTTKDVFWK